MSNKKEEKLVQRARKGDKEAFSKLYDYFIDSIYRFIFFKVKDEGSTVIEGVDYSPLEEKIKEAAESCPVEVIKYEEN